MPPRDRILHQLKTRGPLTASQIAVRMGVTAMAVRQHLYQLHDDGIVGYRDERRRLGRPARHWHLTEKSNPCFPDVHPQLAVDLVAAVRAAFGEEGLKRVLESRMREQVVGYRRRMGEVDGVASRVAALARLRKDEGYMAEWREGTGGTVELIENHCAICQAAKACPRICGMELTAFREVLGSDVSVDRTECILGGDRRCVYEVRPLTA